MDYLVIALASFSASGLTMFSGFGLGTMLLPVFAIFLPVDLAVTSTALVHAVSNVMKVSLLGRYASGSIVVRFGLPAMGAAFVGAALLGVVARLPSIVQYQLFSLQAEMTPIKLALGVLILFFAALELLPHCQRLAFHPRHLLLGGLLSGFFGGLSGHQGALRSAFLAKTTCTPSTFVGTNAVIGFGVDLVRLGVYGAVIMIPQLGGLTAMREGGYLLVGALAASLGIVIGKRLLHKVTMRRIQYLTGIFLCGIGLLLGAGIL
ncbi:MAG: TSUP family transporter [Deltaproteobacteria bacterium]|nr:TSUP family transporter [Deltaproteobacteria bacterium]